VIEEKFSLTDLINQQTAGNFNSYNVRTITLINGSSRHQTIIKSVKKYFMFKIALEEDDADV